jgi:hypothetical protein
MQIKQILDLQYGFRKCDNNPPITDILTLLNPALNSYWTHKIYNNAFPVFKKIYIALEKVSYDIASFRENFSNDKS